MLKILPLGDSITQGSPDQPGGYRGFLEKILQCNGIAFEFAGAKTANSEGMTHPRHEGHPGFHIEQLRTGYESPHSASRPIGETMDRFQPDGVLLLAGTNDLYFDAPDRAALEMSLLISEMLRHKPDLTILLGTLLPILPGPKPWGCVIPEDVGERVHVFNGLLTEIAADLRAKGTRAALADLFPCVQDPAELLEDGVHPRPVVLSRVAKIWAGALNAMF